MCWWELNSYVVSGENKHLEFQNLSLSVLVSIGFCYICCRRLLCVNQARGRSGLKTILGRVLSNQLLGRFGCSLEHETASFTRGKNRRPRSLGFGGHPGECSEQSGPWPVWSLSGARSRLVYTWQKSRPEVARVWRSSWGVF